MPTMVRSIQPKSRPDSKKRVLTSSNFPAKPRGERFQHASHPTHFGNLGHCALSLCILIVALEALNGS